MAGPVNSGRRRVPRRTFDATVGVLLHGKYHLERSFQVGEGGMMISSKDPLPQGVQIVTSFYLTSGEMVIVRGVVRSIAADNGAGGPERYGIEFINLGFHFKRAIRNFVAAATRGDSQLSL